jgi:Domain of unknown function (DUF6473)
MTDAYQYEDNHLIDYGLVEIPKLAYLGTSFRGPAPATSRYIAFVGAAQTFGRFCKVPFPALLGQKLQVEVSNLGRGGVGPAFFRDTRILEHLNASLMVVVQVLSGRSMSNSAFKTNGNMEGFRVRDGVEMIAEEFFEDLLLHEPQSVEAIVEETRANYVKEMRALLNAIQPPKILLWFSVRAPEYQEQLSLPIENLFGEFPQLVNRKMIEELKKDADAYIECVTKRGLPGLLVDRQGNPTSVHLDFHIARHEVYTITENTYYPSKEMHEDAMAALLDPCRHFLADS